MARAILPKCRAWGGVIPPGKVSQAKLVFSRQMCVHICKGTWYVARAILHWLNRTSHSMGIGFLHVFIVYADLSIIFQVRGYFPGRAACIMCTLLRHFKSK